MPHFLHLSFDWIGIRKEEELCFLLKITLLHFLLLGFAFQKKHDILRRIKPSETKMADILLLQSS